MVFLLTQQKSELLYLLAMDGPSFYGVKTGSVNAGMPQDVRQTHHVFLQGIVSPGKEVPQVMGKHLVL